MNASFDGKQAGRKQCDGDLHTTDGIVFIGARGHETDEVETAMFEGSIDEVAVFKVPLDAASVKAIMRGALQQLGR